MNSTPNSRIVMSASGISMRFGGVKALDSVSLSLNVGQWLALIGPNGSGKTTLLNVLSGIYIPTTGQLALEDRDLTRHSVQSRARAGIVRTFQHPQLASTLTLVESVMFGGDLLRFRDGPLATGDLAQEARQALADLNCEHFADNLPTEAPYGAQKMAELARALMARPKVLLLDEPAAGLSREERAELIVVLQRLRKERPETSVCLVEHDVGLVAALCSDMHVLNFGKTLSAGTTETVLQDPAVRDAFLGSMALPSERREA